ncbi:MAG TPA: carbohydrate ABC transporter permease [Planctomycetota bacterium]|nr:carbohydrate ABC transporter permease [Planctomycetota bacterium]
MMANCSDRKPEWHLRVCIHSILLVGALFFALPLVWMIATSLKPLDQTMKFPDSPRELLLGQGTRADIDGQRYDVLLEREIAPSPEQRVFVVQPDEAFAAGELTHPFDRETWEKYPVFNKQELARMNAEVTPAMRILTDEKNTFDPVHGVLKLQSGREIRARLLREIEAAPEGKLWLVREWRPEDTDTKEIGSTGGDVNRAWDVVPESRIERTIRAIPENYPAALRRLNFGRSLANTLFLCMMTVTGSVVSSLLVAYGFAFLEFRGRNILFAITVATMMIPFPIVMIPVYLLYRDLGWVGSFKPLWVTSWFGSAFFIFLLRQFFLGLPKALLDAARIDGCSELEILWHVVVPLSRPAIAMVALFTFLGTWKDFLGPLIYLNHQSQFTLSLSLQSFASEHGGTPWHLLMAASTVFSLPLIILFFIAMKTFIRGVAMTGMKG